MHGISAKAEPLLPSNHSKCRAVQQDVNEEGTRLRIVQTAVCHNVDCSCNWYGPRCDLYCEDLTTCNGHGFCTSQGACLCFPPAKGPFCNESAEAIEVGDGCQLELEETAASSPMAAEPAVQVSVTWVPSPPSLRFEVESPASLAAWTALSYTIPSTTGLVTSEGGVPEAVWTGSLASSTGQRIEMLPSTFARPRCFSSRIVVSEGSGSMCTGSNPVRVCATSMSAAQEYVERELRPLIEGVTEESCSAGWRDTCGANAGPNFGLEKATCCQFPGTWDLGQCATDDDCGPPVDPSEARVLQVDDRCCSSCQELQDKMCGGGGQEICQTCSAAVPCAGYSLSKSAIINATSGGAVTLDNGAGLQVPPGVWPEGAGPASVSVYTEFVEVPAQIQLLCDPIFFGPTGTSFSEPVTMVFAADPNSLAQLPSDMRMLTYKIVDGQLVEHAFAPQVDMQTGLIMCSTMSFSAYVVAAVPIVVETQTTPAPDTTLAIAAPAPTPAPVKVPPIVEVEMEDGGIDVMLTAIIASAGAAICICLGVLVYVRRSAAPSKGKFTEVTISEYSGAQSLFRRSSVDESALSNIAGRKISMQAVDSSRVQESHPGGDFLSKFQVSGDMVHADGRPGGPATGDSSDLTGQDSSEIEERLFEADMDMEEEEPVMRPISQTYTPEVLAGSVGRFGTGMKPLLPMFRPAASETATSLVWNAPGPSGKKAPVTLTSDLIVLSPHAEEGDEVAMDEHEPEMQGAADSPEKRVKQFEGKVGGAVSFEDEPDHQEIVETQESPANENGDRGVREDITEVNAGGQDADGAPGPVESEAREHLIKSTSRKRSFFSAPSIFQRKSVRQGQESPSEMPRPEATSAAQTESTNEQVPDVSQEGLPAVLAFSEENGDSRDVVDGGELVSADLVVLSSQDDTMPAAQESTHRRGAVGTDGALDLPMLAGKMDDGFEEEAEPDMQPLLHADDEPQAGRALLDSAEMEEIEPAQEGINDSHDFAEADPAPDRIE